MSGYIGTTPVPQATQHREQFTATASQTSFPTAGYTPQFIDVYLNGVKLATADYTATNGSDVVLAAGAALNDIVEYVAYTPFEVANQTFTGTTTVDVLNVEGAFTSLGIDDNATSTAVTLDASGNVLVGKTSQDQTVVGAEIKADGIAAFTADGTSPLRINRKTSDGTIVNFMKNDTSVGSIGVDSGDNFYVGAATASHSGLYFGNSGALPMAAGARSDNSENLGSDDYRFKDIFLSGGVYLGGTVAANKMDDYEEGTWTPTANVYSGTMTVYEAYYVKVGAMVFIYIDLEFSGDDSSSVTIDGLPFSTSYNQGRGGLSTTFNSTNIDGMWNLGTNNINFKPRTGNGNVTYTQVNTNGKRLGGSGWYIST
jgi:hypothetical protein